MTKHTCSYALCSHRGYPRVPLTINSLQRAREGRKEENALIIREPPAVLIISSLETCNYPETMKFSLLALLASVAVGPAAAEIYLKEQFNDDVSLFSIVRLVVDKNKASQKFLPP